MPTTTIGRTGLSTLSDTTVPAINLCEDVVCLYCEVELPGVPASNIDIQILGNELIIRGYGLLPVPTTATIVRNERGTLRFERSILLPCPILVNDIAAVINNGVLLIVLPKVDAYFNGFNHNGLTTNSPIHGGLQTMPAHTGIQQLPMLHGVQQLPMMNGACGRTNGIQHLGLNTVAQHGFNTVAPMTVPFNGFFGQNLCTGLNTSSVQPVMVRVAA